MGSPGSTPPTQSERFTTYVEGIAAVAGHADRIGPLKAYCTGLLLPGERKSVEPMAARLAPERVRQMHQFLHHLVADAPWDDDEVLRQVRYRVLPAMTRQSSVVAWVIDDTGFPKKGRHSVGVARQCCGQLGKQDNCRVAVSLSVSTWRASLPIAWRLYLPEAWADDRARRQKTGIPDTITFETKPQIALAQIRQAVEEAVPPGAVLADAAYGNEMQFRQALTDLGLSYLVGIAASTTVWKPGEQPLPAKPWSGRGRPTTLLRRSATHHPVSVKALADVLPPSAWKTVTWRTGSRKALRSRFAAAPSAWRCATGTRTAAKREACRPREPSRQVTRRCDRVAATAASVSGVVGVAAGDVLGHRRPALRATEVRGQRLDERRQLTIQPLQCVWRHTSNRSRADQCVKPEVTE